MFWNARICFVNIACLLFSLLAGILVYSFLFFFFDKESRKKKHSNGVVGQISFPVFLGGKIVEFSETLSKNIYKN